ncbi:MAG TPA: ATP-binding protein [Thermoanaerobaculia bacterium]|nr:ATP-binding protein [Thermoanaerobaculia bacterium]
MADEQRFPRFALPRLMEGLADTPVVLIHGPRQCGKTTLAQEVGGAEGFGYISFDDAVTLSAAQTDPAGFVAALPSRTILDEVQRVPGLFAAIKMEVDRNRTPGRFILTGSANVLLVPKLADSLAGRMEIHRLYPLAQCEIGRKEPGFLSALFGASFKIQRGERLGTELIERIIAGGYPAALARPSAIRRAIWYRDYLESLIQRDVKDLARITSLDVLPRLLKLVAGQTAKLLNVTDLAAPFQLSRPTIADYVTLLERVFLLERLPPWHSNRLSRLVKTPKVHIGDTGLAASLLGLDASDLARDRMSLGALLETFVFQELRRQASWDVIPTTLYHFRDKEGAEVDIVLERGSRVAGVEVKASGTVTASDFRGLRKLKEATDDHFAGGVVLYDGEISVGFGDDLYAVPIRSLWEMG